MHLFDVVIEWPMEIVVVWLVPSLECTGHKSVDLYLGIPARWLVAVGFSSVSAPLWGAGSFCMC